ncbi:helix-turn-helix domain-containing protein [Escherichia coli]|uniref:helix-turn-helix domain-containing protein n=1 Tax=Escherichia coli TaxID=562 RepID=UPI00201AFF97|nr:helix-turn-helix domain-containing protein [Escherichia coli]DAL98209.1 MAG TPA: helix-turn-helix domain protein [Caudoviricetes sp.]
MEEEIFTREEAASYLKVDKGTITQWIRSGRLQAAKINPDKPKSPYRICKSDCIAACHERCNSDPHPTPEIRSRG